MKITIRPVRKEDAESLHRIRVMPGVRETITSTPAERLAHSEAFLNGMGDDDYQFTAVAEGENGEELVVGTAGLVVCQGRMRHMAGFGIMVHADYHNKGVGSALMAAVLDLADNWLGLKRVELTAFADNARALHLYERFGFEREGVRRMACIKGGGYADEVYMARLRP